MRENKRIPGNEAQIEKLALSALFVVILQFITEQVVQYEWQNQKKVSVISGPEMP